MTLTAKSLSRTAPVLLIKIFDGFTSLHMILGIKSLEVQGYECRAEKGTYV
jgi:hypothetical protein